MFDEVFPLIVTNETIEEDEQRILDQFNLATRLSTGIGATVLIALGIPGNYFTIRVLNRQALKDKIFTVYLTSMCFYNIATLLFSCGRLLTVAVFGKEFVYYSLWFCMLTKLTNFTLVSITTWHLVVISTLRLLYLGQRTRCLATCLSPSIGVFLISLICFGAMLCIVLLGMREEDDYGHFMECHVIPHRWPVYLLSFSYAIGPSVMIIFCNIGIFLVIRCQGSQMTDLTHTIKVRQHLMFLGFVSSIQFTITCLPVTIYMLINDRIFNSETRIGSIKNSLGFYSTTIILLFNNASSFITYCFFGKNFRIEGKRVVRKWCKRHCSGCITRCLFDPVDTPAHAPALGMSSNPICQRDIELISFDESTQEDENTVDKQMPRKYTDAANELSQLLRAFDIKKPSHINDDNLDPYKIVTFEMGFDTASLASSEVSRTPTSEGRRIGSDSSRVTRTDGNRRLSDIIKMSVSDGKLLGVELNKLTRGEMKVFGSDGSRSMRVEVKKFGSDASRAPVGQGRGEAKGLDGDPSKSARNEPRSGNDVAGTSRFDGRRVANTEGTRV